MKIKVVNVIGIFIIIIASVVKISYAKLDTNISANTFINVNKNEIAPKETLEITFDLDKIKYNSFKILLNTNIDNKELYTNDNVILQEKSDSIVINIEKNILNLNKINVCYIISDQMEINSKIQISAKVIVEEEIERQANNENIISSEQVNKENLISNEIIIEESKITEKQEKIILEENKIVSIIEKNKDANFSPENEEQSKQNNNNILNNTDKKSSKSISITKQTSNTVYFESSKKTETATYKGSNNNYLSELSVEGINLNTEFNKENTNYFININNTLDLKVNYKSEESSAKVSITGMDNIKEGINKILITVTAKNGDVRYYRIFAKCTLSE